MARLTRTALTEATATLDELGRLQREVDLALRSSKHAQDTQRQGQRQEKEGRRQRSALVPSLQRRGHGARAAGTVPRSSASQSFEVCTAVSFFPRVFPEPDSHLTVRRWLSGWCPTGALSRFSLELRIMASTGVNNNTGIPLSTPRIDLDRAPDVQLPRFPP